MTKNGMNRSQNLFIIRRIWKIHKKKSMGIFYDMVGITDSQYSFIIKNPASEEAVRIIKKNKEKIIQQGFQYEWFSGETSLLTDAYNKITDAKWLAFMQAKRSDSIYRNMERTIDSEIYRIEENKMFNFYAVYEAFNCLGQNSTFIKNVEESLLMIDTKKLTPAEIKKMNRLIKAMEKFIADVKAMKQYYVIQGEIEEERKNEKANKIVAD